MKKLIYFLCFITVFIGSISCEAQTNRWHAQWIGIPYEKGDTNIWTCYRKTISLQTVSSEVTAKIATDSKYWLWINGRMVVFEGELKRGPNPRDTYYDEVNLAPYLAKGKNTIALLTWYWGRDGFDHKSSGRSALLFEAASGGKKILSDQSWKAVRHPAFGNSGPPRPNYRLPEFNIHFDARKDISGWYKSGFDDYSWTAVFTYGIPPVAPWNNLVKRPIPLWKDEGLRKYANNNSLPKKSTGEVIVAKLPKNITITPYLKIDAPAGLKIDMRTDNYKGGSEYNVRTEYITHSGIQSFETFAYMNGHDVRYAIPPGVKILALKYRETRYNTTQIGSFSCDDSFYNRLWEKSYNTMNLNLRDAIQDPDRERAQWWGDAVILMGEILYACDHNGLLAIQKAIRNLVDWQKPDSVLYSPVPAGSWTKELPAQMLASVGRYGFWNYYCYTGDTAMIRYVYPAVERYIHLWKMGRDGLVVHRPGGWEWLDWGADIDVPLLDNAWYYMALDAAKSMARLTGHGTDTSFYVERMQSIKENVNKRFWNGKAYRSPENNGVTDDRGNGLAVVAGLADAAKYPYIKKILQTEFHASPYMEKYIMESFFIMHDAAGGLSRMKRRYDKMVSSPITTLWEGWGIGSEGYGGGSYNHGWSGGPLTLLGQYIAGIAPETAAYTTFHILPQPGDLRHIHCIVPTVKGKIALDLKIDHEEKLSMTVDIPKQTEALVGVPRSDATHSRISLNGKLLVGAGHTIKNDPSVKFKGSDKDYFYFTVRPGKWTFVLF